MGLGGRTQCERPLDETLAPTDHCLVCASWSNVCACTRSSPQTYRNGKEEEDFSEIALLLLTAGLSKKAIF